MKNKNFKIPKDEHYGIIPASTTEDRRFSIEAKMIYSYFLAHAGVMGYVTVPVEKICYDLKISRNRFYNHIKELKSANYITITKVKSTSTGEFYNMYRLHDPINAYNFDEQVEAERMIKFNEMRQKQFRQDKERRAAREEYPDFVYEPKIDPEIEELFNKYL